MSDLNNFPVAQAETVGYVTAWGGINLYHEVDRNETELMPLRPRIELRSGWSRYSRTNEQAESMTEAITTELYTALSANRHI